jgi:hypothetical protein
MIDIPLAKDIDPKTPIEIQTETGIFRLFPVRVKRGKGDRKWCVAIEGICHSRAELLKQSHVLFKGQKIGGIFSRAKEASYLWHVTYEMIIAIPEFWGEA